MTADEQRIRVQQVLDAFTAGEMDRAVAWFDPDVVVHEAPSLPYGGTHRGVEAFLGMLTTLADNYQVVVESHQLISSDDGVLLYQDMTFTSTATGRSTRSPGIEIWRFTRDLISDIDIYYKDTRAMVDIFKNT